MASLPPAMTGTRTSTRWRPRSVAPRAVIVSGRTIVRIACIVRGAAFIGRVLLAAVRVARSTSSPSSGSVMLFLAMLRRRCARAGLRDRRRTRRHQVAHSSSMHHMCRLRRRRHIQPLVLLLNSTWRYFLESSQPHQTFHLGIYLDIFASCECLPELDIIVALLRV